MIIDTHVYIGSSLAGYRYTENELLDGMERNKIDRCFLLPVMPYDYQLEKQNEVVSHFVKRFPDKFMGFCRVDPRQKGKSVETFTRGILEWGLTGLTLNPWEENFQVNNPIVDPLMEEALKFKVPVIIEAGYPWVSHATQIADLCSRYPDLPVIMTHGGMLNISGLAQADAMAAMKRCANLLIDTAGVYRQDFLEDVIENFGADRIVFGSHAPVFSQDFELKRVFSIKTGEEEREKILSLNALRLHR